MLTRRDLLRSLLAAPLVLTSHGLRSVSAQERIRLLDLRAQRQFVNRLERPARALPAPGTRHYEIAVRQFRRSVGLIDPRTGSALETTLWGYDGQYPGPTFEVRRGEVMAFLPWLYCVPALVRVTRTPPPTGNWP